MILEEEWISFLTQFPNFKVYRKKILVLVPHPDDEVLGIGGLLINLANNNYSIIVIAVTNGEAAYKNTNNLGIIRVQEQSNALKQLGVFPKNVFRLNIPDNEISLNKSKIFNRLKNWLTPSTHIFAPWIMDFHPDHKALGEIATNLAQQNKLPLSYYFFWTWHYFTPSELSHLPLKIFHFDNKTLKQKQLALNMHHSQLEHHDAPILPAGLLKPTQRYFEVFLDYECKPN